ncbi:MAG: AAA family ATPase [Caldicoprobacterales bacterium]
MSRGLLLHGEPGVGKSLMAMSFIKESGRNSYIIRRNKHDGDFINEIKGVFSKAAQNAPSIILLDDMDKFVVEDKSKEEYVAVQACIDEVSSLDVYVIATANSIRDIPRSLLRAGRFDRKIRVYPPRGNDAEKIIRHYLESKSIISDVNFDDIAKMLIGRSCAELETIINEAAIYAGYERKEKTNYGAFSSPLYYVLSMVYLTHFCLLMLHVLKR